MADRAITASGLPPLRSSATAADPVFAERAHSSEEFADRVWIYAVGALGLLGAGVAIAVRAAPLEGRRQIFTDLGVAGVLVGALSWYLASRQPELTGDSNGEGAFALVPVTMLAAAAIGGVAVRGSLTARARREGSGERSTVRPIGGRAGETIARVALSLAGASLVLLVVGIAGRGCGEGNDVQGLALWLASVGSLAAAGCGLASLVARRWFTALITTPMPVLVLVVVLGSCLE